MTDVEVDFDSDLARLVELNQTTHGRDGLRPDDAISIQTLRESRRGVEQTSRFNAALDSLQSAILAHKPNSETTTSPSSIRTRSYLIALAISLAFLSGMLFGYLLRSPSIISIGSHQTPAPRIQLETR